MFDEDVIKVRKQYNISDDAKFPAISRFDPVAIAIGIKPEEFCKIVRPSKTTITSNYYRKCNNN